MSEQVTIYALVDPRDSAVRYIGRTSVPLEVRLWQHWMDRATGSAAKVAWIGTLREAGKQPIVKALEVVTAAEAAKAERHHIAAARAQGAQLFNGTGGRRRAVDAPDERDVVRYALRLPRDLYDELAALSDAGGWSLHTEMIRGLRGHVKRERRGLRAPRPAREAS